MTDAESRFAESAQSAGVRRSSENGSGTDRTVSPGARGSSAPAGRRPIGGLAAALAAALGLLIVFASPASALDTGHSYSFSFKGSGTSELGWYTTAIAVDNSSGPSSGDVYVTDYIHHRIEKFDAEGNFILMFGDEVNATTSGDVCTAASGNTCKVGNEGSGPGQFSSPSRLTVDQNTGSVYVMQTESKVAKYDENGNLVTGWGEQGYITGGETAFQGIFGISIDSSGNLLVATSYSNRTIEKFSTSTGLSIEEFQPGFSFGYFAASPQNFDYFISESNGSLKRINSNNTNPVWFSNFFYGAQSLWEQGLSVDSSSGAVYTIIYNFSNEENKVGEWKVNGSGQPLDASGNPCATVLTEVNPGCAPTHEFGFGLGYYGEPRYGGMGNQRATAVNASTGRVYTTATIEDGGVEKSKINVFIPAPAPLVTTEGPAANKTVSGTVKPDGAGEVTECYFEYGITRAYGSKQSCSPATPYTSDQAVTAALTVTNETLYHYRLVAKNAAGAVSIGEDRTITPHNVESLETQAAENVTRTSALLKGKFDGNGQPTTYWFEWGPSAGHYTSGSSAHLPAGSPTAPPSTPLEYEATSLSPETTYHFRLVAENTVGITFGNDQSFKTLPAVQSLTTEAADPVGRKFATLHASFQGDATHTTYYFEWGTTGSYGQKAPASGGDAASPSGHAELSVELTGLSLETTYHFRISATNPLGTTKGADREFTTLPAVPGLLTKAATGISQEGITLNGEYTGNGEDTTYYWEYGLTTKYGKVAPTTPSDAGSPTGPSQLSTVITDYEAYSTYHFRFVAENPEGKTVGQDLTFETEPALLPDAGPTSASEVTSTSALLKADINPNRWATVYRFEYGPSTTYGDSTEISGPIGSDQFPHEVSNLIENLEPGTLYHVRVVAVNFTGTEYGPDMMFITPAQPRIDSTTSSAVGETTAHVVASINPESSVTTAHFEYGPTAAFGNSTAEAPVGSDLNSHDVGADLSGLAPGTTYHVRVVATNAYGTSRGVDQTFRTSSAAQHLEQEVKPPKHCRKGFVKRNGKCVKKHKKHKKHHRHSTRSHG